MPTAPQHSSIQMTFSFSHTEAISAAAISASDAHFLSFKSVHAMRSTTLNTTAATPACMPRSTRLT